MKTDFVEIFQTIRASLQPYAAKGFAVRKNTDEVYELWSEREVEIEGNKRDEVFFSKVAIADDHVGFYLMSDYADPEVKALFHPDLMKLLKDDTYFRITKLNDELLDQIVNALATGFTLYKQKGWV